MVIDTFTIDPLMRMLIFVFLVKMQLDGICKSIKRANPAL